MLALLFGLAVLGANPPFEAPDEGAHFMRAFQLSEGHWVGERQATGTGGQIPVNLIRVTDPEGVAFHADVKMTRQMWREKWAPPFLRWDAAVPRVFFPFSNTAVAPPSSYLPQTLGIFLGRCLGIGPLGLMYLGRVAGLLVSVGLGYAALRCLPRFRWSAMLLLLCPMNLYLMGSVAPDGVLIGAAFLLTALALRTALDPDRRLSGLELAGVVVLLAFFLTVKFVYAPLVLAGVILIWPRLRSPQRVVLVLAGVGLGLVPAWLWSRVIVAIYSPMRGDVPIDPIWQLHFVEHAPLTFLKLVVRTIRSQYLGNYQWFVGVLGYGDTQLPSWFYPFYGAAVLGCCALESRPGPRLKWRHRVMLLAAVAAAIGLIYAAQYSSWNSPGSQAAIEGIEGRYFLPLAPVVLVCFPAIPLPNVLLRAVAPAASVVALVSAAVCLWAVITRFYIGG